MERFHDGAVITTYFKATVREFCEGFLIRNYLEKEGNL